MDLARAQAIFARKFDRGLEGGLGMNDFMILFYLNQTPEEKMRRIDLAKKMGLTASGITRLLLPMEKIGLVRREGSELDARIKYVKLAPGGKRLLNESLETAESLAQELLPLKSGKIIEDLDATINTAAEKAGDYL